jgi:hypothetical protein
MNKISFIFLIALYFILKGNFLFSQEPNSFESDDSVELTEIISDSVKADSLAKKVVFNRPIKKHGSIFILRNNAHQFIPKQNIQKNDYLDLGEIVIQEGNFYPLHHGSLGLNNTISFASGLNNQFQLNGVNVSNPLTLNNNISMYSPEYTENIEIYTGSVAAIFSDNSNSTLINLPEINYNTSKPFFRFWAADAGADYLAIDGIFSQNISPNLNFNLGIRSLNGDGIYQNDEVRNRSIRAGLRWNFDSLQNISITWQHNNHYQEMFGGLSEFSLNNDGSLNTDPITALSRFNSNAQRDVNNNIIINYTKLSSDTNSSLSAQAYVINDIMYDFTNRTLYSGTFFPNRTRYTLRKIGGNISYEKQMSNLFIKGKLDLFNSTINDNLFISDFDDDYLNYSFSGFGAYKIDKFEFSGGLRQSRIYNNPIFNYGANIKYHIKDYQFFILDYSHSEIAPTLVFPELNNEINELVYLRYINQFLNNSLDFDIYFRSVSNMHLHTLYDNMLESFNMLEQNNYFGANLNFKFRLFNDVISPSDEIYVIFKNNLSIPLDESPQLNPLLHTFIDTYITIPKGRSRADLGIRLSLLTENSMPFLMPDLNLYIESPQTMPFAFARNEVYARLRLGKAYLKLTLSNFLNNDFYYVPYYNGLPSNFRASFNWTFS